MEEEVKLGNVDSIFHIGDISYATGFLVEWDYFLHLITPVASRVSYMTAIGNHERYLIKFLCVYNHIDPFRGLIFMSRKFLSDRLTT